MDIRITIEKYLWIHIYTYIYILYGFDNRKSTCHTSTCLMERNDEVYLRHTDTGDTYFHRYLKATSDINGGTR